MKLYNITQLRKMPLDQLSGDEFIVANWKEDGIKVIGVVADQHTIPMTMDNFLTHCTACGGDWGTMLLSGVKVLYPAVYAAIPNEMGHFAFRCICEILELLQIKGEQ